MRRLLIRPGAIGDCILSLPALEYLAAAYTEVWISSPIVPLIGFADVVCPLSSTGLDTLGVGDLEPPPRLIEKLKAFDSIVSWYGSNRPEFRETILKRGIPCEFHAALPTADFTGHATDFFAWQVGAPQGLVARIPIQPSSQRDRVVIHPILPGPSTKFL